MPCQMACMSTKLSHALQSYLLSPTTTPGMTVVKKMKAHGIVVTASRGAINGGTNIALTELQAAITKACGCIHLKKSAFSSMLPSSGV